MQEEEEEEQHLSMYRAKFMMDLKMLPAQLTENRALKTLTAHRFASACSPMHIYALKRLNWTISHRSSAPLPDIQITPCWNCWRHFLHYHSTTNLHTYLEICFWTQCGQDSFKMPHPVAERYIKCTNKYKWNAFNSSILLSYIFFYKSESEI